MLGEDSKSRYGKEKTEEAHAKFLFGEEGASGKQAPNLEGFQPPSTPLNNHASDTVERRNPAPVNLVVYSITVFTRVSKTSQVVFSPDFERTINSMFPPSCLRSESLSLQDLQG